MVRDNRENLLEASLLRRNSAATTLIQRFLGLLSMRSVANARDGIVFFGSAVKDPDTTKQKCYDYLAGGGSQLKKADFARCSGIFRLRSGTSPSEDSLEVAVPGKHGFMPDSTRQVGVDFAGDCQGSVETFLRIKRLIEARCADAAVDIRLDIGDSSVAIPIDSNWMLVLYSAADSLRILDWIEFIRAADFRFCPNIREVFAGLQREIGGFRDCRKLERVELSRSVEVVGRGADEDEDGRGTEAERARSPIFLTADDESWLRRRRR
jgi:hypothetical protein